MVDTITWTLENKGDVIELENFVPKKYFKRAGRSGFGMAPTEVSMVPSVRGGSRKRRSRRLPRTIDLPIEILGENRTEVEDAMRRLARILQDDVSDPKLVGTYQDGKRVWTSVAVNRGPDPTYGSDSNGRTRATALLVLVAPNPYWVQEQAVEYIITNRDSGRSFSQNMAEMRLVSSQTIGTVSILNEGDVEAYPVWVVEGPADSFTATLPDGREIQYSDVIAPGERITIDTASRTIEDQNGVNKYTSLGTNRNFFAIPSGQTKVSVVMLNSTGASRVSVYFNPRFELVFG